MSDIRNDVANMSADQAADHALNHDLGDMFESTEVVRERRSAKMVTALRIDLDVQGRLEAGCGGPGGRHLHPHAADHQGTGRSPLTDRRW